MGNPPPKEGRTPCPECGSTNIMSKGVDWLCKDCMRKYRKVYRCGTSLNKEKMVVDLPTRVEDIILG